MKKNPTTSSSPHGYYVLRSPRQSTTLVLRIPGRRLFPSSLLHLSRNVIATWKDWTKEALICVYISSLAIEWQRSRIRREKTQNNGTTKSRASLSFFLSQKQRKRKRSTGNASVLCFVVCLWRDFLSLSRSLSFPYNLLQKKKQREMMMRSSSSSFPSTFGSEEDAERAEKTERG